MWVIQTELVYLHDICFVFSDPAALHPYQQKEKCVRLGAIQILATLGRGLMKANCFENINLAISQRPFTTLIANDK